MCISYLLQWEGIRLGKKLGYTHYDFFGIAPACKGERGEYVYDEKHQYAGVTRFKLGFGGEVVEHPGTFDLILQPMKYKVYQLFRTLRRLV
jgi:lipid II:glycine glycyltransferase (peptidoglycan interpeptide bridge formation enzyme)